jgi:hypothetical protein
MHDLMSDSIFIPFCNSIKPVSYAQTYATFSDFGGRESQLDPLRSTLDERGNMMQRAPPRSHSPPATSNTFDLPSRGSQTSHRHTQSSTLSSALNRATSNRLSTNVSNSSTISGPEYALTDDSGSGDSPGPAEPRTPPTTPPTSDVTSKSSGHALAQSPPKTSRSDSGSWKKMGYRWGWGKKKSAGALRERSDESSTKIDASPKWDSDMSSGHSEPTGEAQEAQNHGSEESKLFPKDMPSSGRDPTLARAPSSEMELAKDQDGHYSVQDKGNLTAWSGGPNANSSHEDDKGEHTEARKEPEHTSESEPGDATMSHVGGKGDGNFDLVDNLLMQWTKLSEDEYLANRFTCGRDAA